LKPIAVEPVPEPALLTEDLLTFTPQSRLNYSSGRPHAKGATELETFKKLISDDVVNRIVAAINAYAERQRGLDEITLFSRQWKDTTQAEIWRYIGCLVYIGMHIEREHAVY
jgi:Transposase IS4